MVGRCPRIYHRILLTRTGSRRRHVVCSGAGPYGWGVQRSLCSRLIAAFVAILTSASTPVLAVAHGVTHAHLASSHAVASSERAGTNERRVSADDHEHAHEHDNVDAPASARVAGPSTSQHAEVRAPSHQHQHDHLSIGSASVSRDVVRLDDGPNRIAALAPPFAYALERVVRAGCAAWFDRSFLARPGPDTGPPPNPRAPPLR